MTEIDETAYRARQKSRARALAIVLGGLVLLFYAISIAKLVINR